mmetsp:Transcript_8568/g.11594  ORF Transcript_8568/g.11594 Transcript_8568/m.11594 type:complete len:218 (+) Transcript_8568:146-799(+)
MGDSGKVHGHVRGQHHLDDLCIQTLHIPGRQVLQEVGTWLGKQLQSRKQRVVLHHMLVVVLAGKRVSCGDEECVVPAAVLEVVQERRDQRRGHLDVRQCAGVKLALGQQCGQSLGDVGSVLHIVVEVVGVITLLHALKEPYQLRKAQVHLLHQVQLFKEVQPAAHQQVVVAQLRNRQNIQVQILAHLQSSQIIVWNVTHNVKGRVRGLSDFKGSFMM